MADYKDSPAWKKAFELAVEVSNLTKKQARAEHMHENVTIQHLYNRDAESIVLDIASAEGRAVRRLEGLRFLSTAQGMLFRLESKILLDVERNYLAREDVETTLKLCGDLKEFLNSKIEQLATEEQTVRLNRQIRPINSRPED